MKNFGINTNFGMDHEDFSDLDKVCKFLQDAYGYGRVTYQAISGSDVVTITKPGNPTTGGLLLFNHFIKPQFVSPNYAVAPQAAGQDILYYGDFEMSFVPVHPLSAGDNGCGLYRIPFGKNVNLGAVTPFLPVRVTTFNELYTNPKDDTTFQRYYSIQDALFADYLFDATGIVSPGAITCYWSFNGYMLKCL